MNDGLYEYLKKEWRYSNHNKYQKYFEEWFSNITEGQIISFTKQMTQGKDWAKNKL